jgi:hypothetical protein
MGMDVWRGVYHLCDTGPESLITARAATNWAACQADHSGNASRKVGARGGPAASELRWSALMELCNIAPVVIGLADRIRSTSMTSVAYSFNVEQA